jgi:prepilin-type N-terminal cleavage/methylation domain-containing protein
MKTERIKGFTPPPIRVADGQVNSEDKQYHRQFLNSFTKHKLVRGFTLVELLTAVAIIAILLGVLMPALSEIKKLARTTRQKAQNNSIEIGLSLYKSDKGEYPPSHGYDPNNNTDPNRCDYTYSGAQTLAEAMFGMDLLNFHPDSVFRSDGRDAAGNIVYQATQLSTRKEAYLDRTNLGVFEPGQIFNTVPFQLKADGHMICDTFTVNKSIGGKQYKVGTPLLYFRANLSPINTQSIWYTVANMSWHPRNIYNYFDNYGAIAAGRANGKDHKLYDAAFTGSNFYNFIRDPIIPINTSLTNSCGRPQRTDSFLLISAGFDGLYGTKDDICNFEPNIE